MEHDANLVPFLVKGADMVGVGFVCAAMARVFFGVSQKIAVKLFDVVFREAIRSAR